MEHKLLFLHSSHINSDGFVLVYTTEERIFFQQPLKVLGSISSPDSIFKFSLVDEERIIPEGTGNLSPVLFQLSHVANYWQEIGKIGEAGERGLYGLESIRSCCITLSLH